MKDRERERVGEEKERERGNGIEKKQKKAAFFFFFFSSSGKCSTGFFLFFNRRWTSTTTTKVFSFTMRGREDKRGDKSVEDGCGVQVSFFQSFFRCLSSLLSLAAVSLQGEPVGQVLHQTGHAKDRLPDHAAVFCLRCGSKWRERDKKSE